MTQAAEQYTSACCSRVRLLVEVAWTVTFSVDVESELVLLTSPEVTMDDPMQILRELPYIRHTRRAAVGVLVDQWLLKNDVSVREAMVMESIETVSSMVSHNLGVSIVPNLCFPDSTFRKMRKIKLGPNTYTRVLGILTRSDCSKIRLVDRLRMQIEATCNQGI